MTDFSEQFAKSGQEELDKNSGLAQELQMSMDADQAQEDKRKSSRFESAYEGSDLSVTGPSMNKYDYESEFKGGNNFKPDADGGIQINNKGYKRAAVGIAGRDLATGKQYSNQWMDSEGYIADGINMLQGEDHNTKTGSSYRNTYGLFEVARGIIDEDGSFEDFTTSVNGPWSNDQLGMAYTSAKATRDVMGNIDSMGRAYYDDMRENYEEFEGRITAIPEEGFTEESLASSADWLRSGREALTFADPLLATELSDEELDNHMKSFMADFRHNLPAMMYYADMAQKDTTGTFAKNLLVMDEMYDALELSLPVAGRVAGSIFSDVSNYVTLGGGILVTELGKQGLKEGIRFSLRRLTHGLAFDAAVGAGFGAEFESKHQEVEMAAGVRSEKDMAQIATMAGIEGAANVLIGGPINVLADKQLRGFAGQNLRKGLDAMKENSKVTYKHPSGFKAQKGAIDIGPTGSGKVQLTFKMQDWLDTGIKDGAKPTTVRQKIKEGINKGIIKPEEVKWSGIEKFLDKAEAEGGTGISKGRLMDVVREKTPEPKLTSVAQTSYQDYSFVGANFKRTAYEDLELGVNIYETGGYRERMLVIPDRSIPEMLKRQSGDGSIDAPVAGTPQMLREQSGVGSGADVKYRPSHFQSAQIAQLEVGDDMIGHSRVENATLGESKGKMVLEIQSDYHKTGQQGGYFEGEEFTGKGPVISGYEYDEEKILIDIAIKHGIDPNAKNSMSKLWPFIPDEIKNEFKSTSPKLQPFGKNWDAMGMRLEIMDSINAGDEFIAWPANAEQINVIEQWGAGYSNEGIIKRATDTRIKEMKKLGFEVEQIDMPQYKGLGKTDITSEAGVEEFNNVLDRNGQEMIELWDEKTQKYSYELWTDPEGMGFTTGDMEIFGGEKLRSLTETEYYDFVQEALSSGTGIEDSTFNVIRLTDDVKQKFFKGGMPAYSVGAGVSVEEIKKQKREKNGRFK